MAAQTAQTNKLDPFEGPESRLIPGQSRLARIHDLTLRAKRAIKGHTDVPLDLRRALDLIEIETAGFVQR